jgi:hypothetical protein
MDGAVLTAAARPCPQEELAASAVPEIALAVGEGGEA